MAQGFKPSKPSSSAAGGSKPKGRSSASTGPKRGPRVIAPKKAAAVRAAVAKQKQQGSLTSQIEHEMAGRAAGGGPLKLMKKLGEQAKKEREAARAKKGKK